MVSRHNSLTRGVTRDFFKPYSSHPTNHAPSANLLPVSNRPLTKSVFGLREIKSRAKSNYSSHVNLHTPLRRVKAFDEGIGVAILDSKQMLYAD